MSKKYIYSAGLSASTSIISTTILTILAEENSQLKNWLQSVTGHHWVTKSILAITIFFIIFIFLINASNKTNSAQIKFAINFALWCAVLSSILLLAYFSGHYFKFW